MGVNYDFQMPNATRYIFFFQPPWSGMTFPQSVAMCTVS